MALFGKKTSGDGGSSGGSSAPAKPAAPAKGAKKGLSFGRKKTPEPAPAAPASGVEDFSDFADFDANVAAPAPTPAPAPRRAGKPPKPEKKGLRGGAVVGINIGNDSIKAVEIKGKGTQVSVSAIAIAPTPPESISNGVVMSTTALSSAIRAMLKSSGISTKRVISSVSGSGALVVRVIEVPEMSDAELQGNMTQDADRYIPFPPSEVIMDFKALRQLPVGADGNMEVLLAAAQREIVDLHINVLMGAKLDPQSVDVEPLAAARSLNFDSLSNPPRAVDYGDVSALINIGATNTEISVLRGDLLVFTRSVPRGGSALTQAISDTLGLGFTDAERLKQEMGDALAPAESQPNGQANAQESTVEFDRTPIEMPTTPRASLDAPTAATTAPADDWDDFAGFGEVEDTTQTTAVAAQAEPDFADFTAPATTAPISTGATSSDPFDDDFFNQGPQNAPQGRDPQEPHAQKQDEPARPVSPFDFSFEDEPQNLPAENATPIEADVTALPSVDAPQSDAQSAAPATMGETEIHSALQPEEMAPRGQMFEFNAIDDPSLPSFPSLPPHLSAVPFDDDLSTLPAVAESSADFDDASLPALVESDASPNATTTSGTTTDDLAALAGLGVVSDSAPAATPQTATPQAESGASAFDFNFDSIDLDAPVAPVAVAPVAVAPVETPTPALSLDKPVETAPIDAVSDDDFDIDALGLPDTITPVAAAAAADDFSTDFGDTDFGDTDFGGDDFGFDAGGFGAGLVGGEISSDITPATIYGILHPQLEELVGEVRRSLEYFGSRYPDAGVRRISLVGGGAKMLNIDAYFTQELGIPSTRGNPFAGITVRAPQIGAEWVDANGPLFAVALGLALRDVA